jgi:hypothetical protein
MRLDPLRDTHNLHRMGESCAVKVSLTDSKNSPLGGLQMPKSG